jgi:hypothetical protein
MLSYSIFNYRTSYRFSDRDLMMRFRGGGVGHKSSREASNFFKKDRDRLDVMEPHEQNDDLNEQEDSEMDLEECHSVNEVDEDEEEDFGYMREESDNSEDEVGADGELGEDGDDNFGPEDDGGIDPDMMGELGFSNL